MELPGHRINSEQAAAEKKFADSISSDSLGRFATPEQRELIRVCRETRYSAERKLDATFFNAIPLEDKSTAIVLAVPFSERTVTLRDLRPTKQDLIEVMVATRAGDNQAIQSCVIELSSTHLPNFDFDRYAEAFSCMDDTFEGRISKFNDSINEGLLVDHDRAARIMHLDRRDGLLAGLELQ